MTVVENKTTTNPAAQSSREIRSFSTHPIQLCKSVIVAKEVFLLLDFQRLNTKLTLNETS